MTNEPMFRGGRGDDGNGLGEDATCIVGKISSQIINLCRNCAGDSHCIRGTDEILLSYNIVLHKLVK